MEKRGVIREGITPRVHTPASQTPQRPVPPDILVFREGTDPTSDAAREKRAAAHDAAIRELEDEDPVARIAEDVAQNSTL